MPCTNLGNLFLISNCSRCFNSFSTNVQLMKKPGSWFLLPKSLKAPVEE